MSETRIINGGVGRIVIEGNKVTKTYKFDKVSDHNGLSFFITDLCCMNILHGCLGFSQLNEITHQGDEYNIEMNYLGEPIKPCNDYMKYFIQMLQRVQVMHEHHIVHCDLKLANILVDMSGNINIIDYSHAKIMDDNNELPFCDTVLQTYYIMSPESYNKDNRNYMISYKTDIWSLGCVLFELITGQSLFDWTEKKVIEQHTGFAHRSRIKTMIKNKEDRKLLNKLLRVTPDCRPEIGEIFDLINNLYGIDILFSSSKVMSKTKKHYKDVRHYRKYVMNVLEFNSEKKLDEELKAKHRIIAKLLLDIMLTSNNLWDKEIPEKDYCIDKDQLHRCIKKLALVENIIDCFSDWYIFQKKTNT
jgi:serine/threonine protein kinase